MPSSCHGPAAIDGPPLDQCGEQLLLADVAMRLLLARAVAALARRLVAILVLLLRRRGARVIGIVRTGSRGLRETTMHRVQL